MCESAFKERSVRRTGRYLYDIPNIKGRAFIPLARFEAAIPAIKQLQTHEYTHSVVGGMTPIVDELLDTGK
jgi:hypothetical protein